MTTNEALNLLCLLVALQTLVGGYFCLAIWRGMRKHNEESAIQRLLIAKGVAKNIAHLLYALAGEFAINTEVCQLANEAAKLASTLSSTSIDDEMSNHCRCNLVYKLSDLIDMLFMDRESAAARAVQQYITAVVLIP